MSECTSGFPWQHRSPDGQKANPPMGQSEPYILSESKGCPQVVTNVPITLPWQQLKEGNS